jgi:hypothetical protein
MVIKSDSLGRFLYFFLFWPKKFDRKLLARKISGETVLTVQNGNSKDDIFHLIFRPKWKLDSCISHFGRKFWRKIHKNPIFISAKNFICYFGQNHENFAHKNRPENEISCGFKYPSGRRDLCMYIGFLLALQCCLQHFFTTLFLCWRKNRTSYSPPPRAPWKKL